MNPRAPDAPSVPDPHRASRRAWRWPAAAVAAAAGLFALCGSALLGCGGPACVNEVIAAAPSPDGSVIAFVFHRKCGTGGSLATQVSVVPFHDSLRGAGNVLAVANDQPIKIVWRGPTTLIVSGFEDPLYQRARPVGSVTVEFR